MGIRKLLKKARNLGLAGILALGISNGKTNAQEIAPANANVIQFGGFNSSFTWSKGGPAGTKGPKVDTDGFYVQVGHGLTDNFTAFIEGSVENPVFNEGFTRPGYNETADISPNHFIAGAGIGCRGRFFRNEVFSIAGEFKVSRTSDFEVNIPWTNNQWSQVYIHGITNLNGTVWAEKDYGPLTLRAGANLSSNYAIGRALTYVVNSPSDVSEKYSEFNQLNKNRIDGFIGIDYKLDDVWKLRGTSKISDGISVDVGVGRSW